MAFTPSRRNAPRPLADLIGAAIQPALAAQGFAGREVLSLWSEIVGERLAARSRPLKIDWPRRRPGADDGARPDQATLVVLVESAFAPELQHAAPVILARVNGHLGWAAVGRVVLKQGPVAGQTGAPAPHAAAVDQAAQQRATEASAPVETPAVREAVARLGAAVLARRDRPRRG
jgi:hypothetical protein